MKREERNMLNHLKGKNGITDSTIYVEVPMRFTDEGKEAIHEYLTVSRNFAALRVNWNPMMNEYTVLYAPMSEDARKAPHDYTPFAVVVETLKTSDTYWNGYTKLAALRPSVLQSYAKNTAILQLQPERYFAAVESAQSVSRFFRWHVSGDIPTRAYFARMVQASIRNPGCLSLAFTKNYEVVNEWISDHGKLPENLRILFSGWQGLEPVNPYDLPETTVYGAEGPAPDWLLCGGNCEVCGCRGLGCWQARQGDIIAFKLH